MKERVRKLREDGEISASSLDTESIEENPRTSPVSSKDYGEDFLRIAKYVTIMKISKEINKRNFWKFKREALNYDVYNEKVWKLFARNSLTKLIININKNKSWILKSYYNNLSYKG